ncbi:MAG: zf-HC2 domain-containing protein [Firmicutes bacterium]|jgi:hypothetical protein|nr:zf-HC2 domain-containing protein [Bacillota bacterium]MDH7496643.1 anti-sigma factor [Bacillota bacterium]
MTCEKAMSLMSAYLDKELGFDEFRQVELHLAFCEECSQEYESLRATKELLGTLKAAELPKEFWPELRERLGMVAAENGFAASGERPSGSTGRSPSLGSWWKTPGHAEIGGSGKRLFSIPTLRVLVPAFLALALAAMPMVWNSYRKPAEAQVSSGIAGMDSIGPYFRDYVISEYDRPLSDKTSVGFVVTGQAVTMYTSDLLERSSLETWSEGTRSRDLKGAPSPSSSFHDFTGNEFTLISYPK